MYFVYVLKSLLKKKYYTGFTDNLADRLNDHNQGKSRYTKNFLPWQIVYSEKFQIKQEAIQREKYFKSAAGRKWLKKNVNK